MENQKIKVDRAQLIKLLDIAKKNTMDSLSTYLCQKGLEDAITKVYRAELEFIKNARVIYIESSDRTKKIKGCHNCRHKEYLTDTGPCRNCWRCDRWQKTKGDTNEYYWPEIPEIG